MEKEMTTTEKKKISVIVGWCPAFSRWNRTCLLWGKTTIKTLIEKEDHQTIKGEYSGCRYVEVDDVHEGRPIKKKKNPKEMIRWSNTSALVFVVTLRRFSLRYERIATANTKKMEKGGLRLIGKEQLL